MTDVVERLLRKVRVLPAYGSGSLTVKPDGTVIGDTTIYDDGMRYANPDGPQAAALIQSLRARIDELEEEGSALAAGSCVHPELLVGDEHGHFDCGIQSLRADVERLTRENERIERNRDMWKGQCERQAETLALYQYHPGDDA